MIKHIFYLLFTPRKIKEVTEYSLSFIDKNNFDKDVKNAFKAQVKKVVKNNSKEIIKKSKNNPVEQIALTEVMKTVVIVINKFEAELNNKKYDLFFLFLTEIWTFANNKLAISGFITIKQANENNKIINDLFNWKARI